MYPVPVFWVVTPCSVAVGYQTFGGPCCFRRHIFTFVCDYNFLSLFFRCPLYCSLPAWCGLDNFLYILWRMNLNWLSTECIMNA